MPELELEAPTAQLAEDARTPASLVAELIVVNNAYSDCFGRLRRRGVMSLAAESRELCCRR